ncbi:hotdog domain-containing protein [Nitriliruptor alkaliphilus]|uniref:hotdog domain-containing protein n=1 Tax=Nitriliruptor alkaliphilus TaxID=427918 RepID=UPI000698C84A|nr:hotdog domain-containing protein [Nitriliruptor alkaliphilus]
MTDTTTAPGSDPIPAALRERWLGGGHEPGTGRRAVHDLAAALRDAAHALYRVDAEHADASALQPLADQVRAVTAVLATQPDHGAHGSTASAPLPASYLPERSPVSGRANALAPPLTYTHDGAITRAHVTYGAAHEGPVGGVHGGVVAAAFDELLGVAQMAAGAAGYTGELHVRFRRITPLHVPVTYEAQVSSREGRRLVVTATSTDGTHVLAESRGTFVIQQHLGTGERSA